MSKKAQKKEKASDPTPNILTKDMGKRIRRARDDAGMTQEELARRIGRRQASISDIENGKIEVNAVTLTILALELQKPIGYFFPDWLMKRLQPEDVKPAEAELLSLALQLSDEDLQRITIQVRALVNRDRATYDEWLAQHDAREI